MLATAASNHIICGARNSVVTEKCAADKINSKSVPQDLRFQVSGGPPDGDEGDGDSSSDMTGNIHIPSRSNGRLNKPGFQGHPREQVHETGSLSHEVQAISSAFKPISSKFSGDLDENILDYLREYDVVCRNLCFSSQRKFDLMHNIFRDDAKEWLFDNIAGQIPVRLGG